MTLVLWLLILCIPQNSHIQYKFSSDTPACEYLKSNSKMDYNSDGYTYGHHGLRNESSSLSRRIDYVFVGPQGNPVIGEGFVLGDERRDFNENGLWPSDHAGVVTKLTYAAPGKLASN